GSYRMKFFKSAKWLKTKAKTKQPFAARLRLTVESLESRWVPAGLPTHEGFVSQAYLDLLHRPVDPTGLAAWTGALDQGATRKQVASGIDNSQEFRTDFVQSTYISLLQRSAEPGGLAAWLGGINAGATLEQTEAGIAGSLEYFQNHGSTNQGF